MNFHHRQTAIASAALLAIALAATPAYAQFNCQADSGSAQGAAATYITDTACGPNATANGAGTTTGDATALGYSANALAYGATALGAAATANGQGAIAIGLNAIAPAQDAIVIGDAANTNKVAVIVGSGTVNNITQSVVVGNGASVSGTNQAVGQAAVSIGYNAFSSENGVVIGATAKATDNQATVIGYGADGAYQAAVLGLNATASGNHAVAIGAGALSTQDGAVAVGLGAAATGLATTAIGQNAASSGTNSVAIGQGSTDGAQSNVVSIGGYGTNRRIINVEAGTSTTDAVNVGQLPGTIGYNATTGAGTVTMGNAFAPSGNSTPVTVTNVAPGAVTATSTDAINGSQLYATNQNVTSAVNTANSAAATATAAQSTANTALGLAQNSVQYDDATHTSVTLNPGGSTVGLHNVAAGTLSSTSTDAVNGSQLYATNQSIANLSGGVTNLTTQINNGTIGLVQQQGGSSAPITIGAQTGGSAVNVAGTAGTRTVTGVTAGSLSATSTDAVNGSQLYATNQNVTTAINTANSAAATATAAQSTANTAMSVATGAQTTANQALGLAQNSVQYDDASHTSVTLNSGGAAAGVHNVAVGTLSSTSTDVVNGSQLYATNQNVTKVQGSITNLSSRIMNGTIGLVQQQGGSSAPITVGAQTGGTQLSVAGMTGDRRLSGVAPGVAGDDAVNVGQLNQAIQQSGSSAVNQANAYTNQQISGLSRQLDALGAEAMAASSLVPNARAEGNLQLAAAAGTYGGSTALAIGANVWLTDRVLLNAHVSQSTGSGGRLGASVGATIGF